MSTDLRRAERLFKHVEDSIQDAIDVEKDMFVRVERDIRGTYPTLIVRVLPSERSVNTKQGVKLLSPQNGSQRRTRGAQKAGKAGETA